MSKANWWRIGFVLMLVTGLLATIGLTQGIKNPVTAIVATFGGPITLDPAWHYDTDSAEAIHNIYEPLIWYEREKIDKFVPVLATGVPVPERLPDGGMRIVFKIRKGIKFHEGGTLEPHDVAYSYQRLLLQDRAAGPVWMWLEPFFGVSAIDELAEQVGDLEACKMVKEAIQADDENWTVTLTLKEAFSPIIQILAGTWGSVLDKEWMIEQGDWDDTCENWRKWHNPAAEESKIFNKANGTGPYKLEAWIPGEEIRFTRNDNYWRGMPDCLENYGPEVCWGKAKLASAVIKFVAGFETRLAMFKAGDADIILVPRAFAAQMDPLVKVGKARMYKGLSAPEGGTTSEDAFFNFLVAERSPFMPLLDGKPKPDLLSDIHMRRALNYCFDTETYIKEAWLGEAEQRRGPIPRGLLGFNPDQPVYEFSMEKCEKELELAFGGTLEKPGLAWTKPLRLVLTYNTGNIQRKIAAELLKKNLESLNAKRTVRNLISIEVRDLPWLTYLKAMDAKQLAVFWLGWLEDYHHPHNWVQPFMHRKGAFAQNQNFQVIKDVEFAPVYATWLPAKTYATLQDLFDELIEMARMEPDLEKARLLYFELNRLAIDWAIDIFQAQLLGRHYEQPWLQGWFFNPAYPGYYFFWYWKSQPIPFKLAPNETKTFELEGAVELTLTAGPAGAEGDIGYTPDPWRVDVIDKMGGLTGQRVALTYKMGLEGRFDLMCSNVPAAKWNFGFAQLGPTPPPARISIVCP
jgi:peptide/nickel transport system substrate-binding protein